jgi:hypothetical protein
MRRMRRGVIGSLTTLGTGMVLAIPCIAGPGVATAEEPDPESPAASPAAAIEAAVEIHRPTPPDEKLRGADIYVHPMGGEPHSQIENEQWDPESAARIPVADWRMADPSRIPLKAWQPGAPSRIPVRSWDPFAPSRIRVHGPY